VLEQDAADDRPEGRSGGEHRRPHRDRDAALVAVGEDLRSSDSVDGMSIAPNTPIPARAAISQAALGAKAASTETAAKPVAPISSIRRRPNRSPSVPIVTRSPASTSG
jgi:hypothetical protein